MARSELTHAEVERLLQGTPETIDLFSPWGFLDWFGPTMPNRR